MIGSVCDTIHATDKNQDGQHHTCNVVHSFFSEVNFEAISNPNINRFTISAISLDFSIWGPYWCSVASYIHYIRCMSTTTEITSSIINDIFTKITVSNFSFIHFLSNDAFYQMIY